MSDVNTAARQKLASYLTTQSGRAKIAQALTQPLRLRRDYMSVGRKTFLVEQLPDGALPYYDKDPDVAAYVIGEEGQNILSVVKGRRVLFPLFEIASNPEIPLTQIRERRYDVIERVQDQARSMIQKAEDERVFSIMDAVSTNGFDSVAGQQNPDIAVAGPITQASLADAFGQLESNDLQVARIYLNPRDYTDFRKFGRDLYDPETQQALLRTGLMGTLWGAQVITSIMVPTGTVYVTCTPEEFGRIPVRTELTVLSADDPRNRSIGFSIFENIGIGCHNPYGLQRMILTR